jgi:hypothetical protein
MTEKFALKEKIHLQRKINMLKRWIVYASVDNEKRAEIKLKNNY